MTDPRPCQAEARAEGFMRLALMATMAGLQPYLRYGCVDLGHVPIVLPDGVELEGARMETPLVE